MGIKGIAAIAKLIRHVTETGLFRLAKAISKKPPGDGGMAQTPSTQPP